MKQSVIASRFDREFELLLALLRASLRLGSLEDGRRLLKIGGVDWARFERLTIAHGVVSIVYDILVQLKEDEFVADDFWGRYSLLNRRLRLSQLRQVQELLEMSRAFEARRIRFMTLKGPVISQLFYKDAAQRHSNDIDLLVLKDDLPKVSAAMDRLGYIRSGEPFDDRIEKVESRESIFYHEHYIRGQSRVEIHWRLSVLDFMISDSIEVLYDHRGAVEMGGQLVPHLGESDLVDYLTMHGTAHCWHRLKWLYDIVKAREFVNIESKQAGLTRAVAMRNRLIEVLFGETPLFECSRRGRFLARISLSQIVEDQLGADSPKKVLGRTLTILFCAIGLQSKLRYLTTVFCWPVCYERFPLPKYLSFLYIVLGPLYWVYKKMMDRLSDSKVSSR